MISNQDKEDRDASQSQSTLSEDDLMQLLSNIDNLSYTEIDSKIRSFIFSSNELLVLFIPLYPLALNVSLGCLFEIFLVPCLTINFPLGTPFTVSHTF